MRLLATSPRYPDEILAEIITTTDSLNGLYRINFLTQEKKKTGKLLPYQKVYFDQEFNVRAARTPNEEGGFSMLVHNSEGWMTVAAFPFDESQFLGGFQDVIAVHSSGDKVYITDNKNKDKTALYAVSTATGEKQLLLADGKADLLPFGAMIDTAGSPQMVLSVFGHGRRHFLSSEAQADFDYANQLLEGQASYAQASKDGQKWLLRKLNGGPIDYYLFDRVSRKLTRLFNDLPELSAYPVAQRNSYSVISRDGYELPINVYLPPGADADADGKPQRVLPTIIYVHGGPWAGVTHWNQWFHNRNFQLLANRGYAVINAEFRSSTGLGKHFIDLGDRQWGDAMLNDKIDIAAWAVESGIADEDRMGIWGWSYGGYAAAAALAFAPDVFACGISMYSPMDLDAFSRIPFTDSELWRNRVGNPNEAGGSAQLKRQSPQYAIEHINSPMLLTTGSKDARVPQKQMDDFAEGLHEAGKAPIYFYYPDEQHDYREAGSWISFWAIAEQFLHQNLGGNYQKAGDDLQKGKFNIVYGQDFVDSLR
jgi:dipeptidyl aminopeptidase/acylaminoacyl peptidase